VYDASYWYDRNLGIIANIERQFLTKNNLNDIQYYFAEHRPTSKMLTHLRIPSGRRRSVVAVLTRRPEWR
jgi:hypothetical protein